MTNQAKIISIFVASLLLVSCSSESNSVKFASKEEAFLAQVDFLKESDAERNSHLTRIPFKDIYGYN